MAGNATIGALKVVLGLDTAQFESGLQKARGSIAAFNPAAGLKSALKDVGGALDDVASHAGILGTSLTNMGTLGVAAGVSLGGLVLAVGGVAAVMAQTKTAIGDLAEFSKLSKEVGVSTDFIQQFNYAARQSDIDVGAADEALKGLTVSLGNAQSNMATIKQLKPFTALQFTQEQLRQFQNVGDFFPVLAQRVAAVGNAAEQAAIAKRLGISDLLPLLQAGATNFNTLAKAAQDLGVVIDGNLIAKADDTKTKLSQLDAIMKAQKDSTFVEYAKQLVAIRQAFLDATGAALSFFAAITHTETPEQTLKRVQSQQAGFLSGNQFRNSDGTLTGAAQRHLARLSGEAQAAQAQIAAEPPTTQPPQTPPKKLVDGAAVKSNATASDEAIAAAAKAELNARVALTADIAKLAVLRLAEVDEETAATDKKLQDEANSKKISQAAADTAIASTNQAAIEKKALITRQALFDAQNAELESQEEIDKYAGEISQIQASLAKTADARNAIEASALALRQADEAKRLATTKNQEVQTGKITEWEAEIAVLTQMELQAAQTKQQQVQGAVAVQKEANDRAEAALQLQIDILQSQIDAATTDGERRTLGLQLLALEQLQVREKQQAIIDNPDSSDEAVAAAQNQLAGLIKIQANQTKGAVGSLFDAFSRAESGVSSLAQAFQSHDWGHVVADLVSTFQAIKSDISSGNTSGAIEGAGSAIGSAIGGPIGGAISGAASGAALGSIIPGVGTAIGAVVGGIIGLFSGSAAKKAQDSANAQAAAQAAAAHATAVANEATQLQIQLLEAEGDAEGAVALQRKAAIAGVNAENQALEGQLFDLQQAADAAAAAKAVADQRNGLEIQLLTAEGDAVDALSMTRANELAALDASNQALQKQIYNLTDLASAQAAAAQVTQDTTTAVTTAQQALNDARNAEASALQDTITKYQAFADSLTAFAATLTNTGAAASLSYAALSGQEANLATRAKLGDADALGQLQDAGTAFLTASKASAHTLQDYLRDQARVQADATAAANTATRQVSIAQQQLDALNAQVDELEGVKDAVLTIPEAIANLATAVAAQTAAIAAQTALTAEQAAAVAAAQQVAAAPPPAPATPPPVTVVAANLDAGDVTKQIQDLIAGGSLLGLGSNIQAFATGGSFTAGGTGGPDSLGYKLALTPGEVVNVSHQSDLAALGVKMDKVVAVLDRFRGESQAGDIAIATNTRSIDQRIMRVTPDGNSLLTSSA
jgi:hypothetical protein